MSPSKQRIPYFPPSEMDEAMLEVMKRCAQEGTPRPESSAIRAHSPAAFWAFDQAWERLFRNGVVDHEVKELCRVYVSRSVKCEYCGNQRSEAARSTGLSEGKLDELMNFETSVATLNASVPLSRMPRPSRGDSILTTVFGSDCIRTSRRKKWSKWDAS